MIIETNRPRGLLLAFLGVLCFTPDAALFRLVGMDAWSLLVWRNAFTALTMLVWVLLATPRAQWRQLFVFNRLGWLAVVALAISDIGFMNAVLNAPAADALVVLASAPLLAALVGLVGFGESIPPRTWIAIGLALSGIGLTLTGTALTGGLFGCLMAFVAASGWAVNLNALRFSPGTDARAVVFVSSLLAAAFSLAMVTAQGTSLSISPGQFWLLAVLGLILHPASFGLISMATRYLPSAEIALVSLTETLLGPFWVWLVFTEVPTATTVAGGSIIIATLAVHTLMSLRAAPDPATVKAGA